MKTTEILYQASMKIFNLLPCKKYICYLVRAMGIPNDKFYKDMRFLGKFSIRFNGYSFKLVNYRSSIENEIFWNGLGKKWEKDTLWLWFELSAVSNVIIDIGANTGIYSIISKILNPAAVVHAFEPSRSVFPKLVHNNKINGLNVHCWQLALSNFSGTQTFYDSTSELPTSGSLAPQKFFNECEDETLKLSYPVDTITFDEFISIHHIDKIDLIKIDVEMYEVQVMEGFQTCDSKRPIIFIEILTDEIAEKLQKLFSEYAYLFYELDYKKLIPIQNLKKGRPYHWNFLLVPQEKKKIIEKYLE